MLILYFVTWQPEDDEAMIVDEPDDDDSLMEIDELPSTRVSIIYFLKSIYLSFYLFLNLRTRRIQNRLVLSL